MSLNPVHDILADRNAEPTVGMGATFLYFSDREPGTVVEVKRFQSGARKGQVRRVAVQYDNWKIVSGDGSFRANYPEIEYTPNPNSPIVWCQQNARGQWVVVGKGGKVQIGHREYYCDPHF